MEVRTCQQFSDACRDLTIALGYNLYDAVLYDNGTMYRYEHQPANLANNSYSVSKIFTAAAIGFLVDDGKISLNDLLTDILKDEIHTTYDPQWDKVTVEHALAHKMGLQGLGLDLDSDDISTYGTKDFLTYVFTHALTDEPGTVYNYSDTAYYLLSRVVSKITGQRMDDFLMDRLFRPLDYAEVAWSTCPYGYPMGGTGLYLRTHDMLKLAVLYLNLGVWEGKRILSENWIRTSLERELGVTKCENISHCKTGAHGQILAFCPTTQKAIAIHGFNNGNYEFRGAAVREFIEK
jgi:CubicO group peptidase (beta-lactamase class C family)